MSVFRTFARLIAQRETASLRSSIGGVPVEMRTFMSDGDGIEHASVDAMWRKQPHLRTVVDFMAKQVAQIGLHAYTRDDDETKRVTDGPVADFLEKANDDDTGAEFVYALVHSIALYDDVVIPLLRINGRPQLHVFPTTLFTLETSGLGVDYYVLPAGSGAGSKEMRLRADQVLRFRGWNPGRDVGASPVETLRLLLEEQHDARVYRKQIWKKAGRFGGILSRPAGAPEWGDTERKRFDRMWHAFTGNGGSRAGDTPLLEDGLKYERIGFAAREDQWLESTKLSLETCAQVYGINPTMVGALDNANYSNVREFRRALFGDSLGWIIKRIERRFNAFLLPWLGAEAGVFVEFNVEAKLRGSFEEQAEVVSTATGAPWQTVNESRRLFNLGPIDGGDELVRPLNVLFGNQASPQDGGDGKSLEALVAAFAQRQAKSVASKRAAGGEWWDEDRWHRELATDLVSIGFSKAAAEDLSRLINRRLHGVYETGATPTPDALEVLP